MARNDWNIALLFSFIVVFAYGDSSITKRSGRLNIGDTWNPPSTAFDNDPQNCKKDSNSGENSYQHFEISIDRDGMLRVIASFDSGIADTAKISIFQGSALDIEKASSCKGHIQTFISDSQVHPSIDSVVKVSAGTYQVVIYSTLKNSGSSETATQYIVHIVQSAKGSWSDVVEATYVVPELGSNCTSGELLAPPSSFVFAPKDSGQYDVYAYAVNTSEASLFPTLSLYNGSFEWSNKTVIDPCSNSTIASSLIDTRDYSTSADYSLGNGVRITAQLIEERPYTVVLTLPYFYTSEHALFVTKSIVGDTSQSAATFEPPVKIGSGCDGSSTPQHWQAWVFKAENTHYHIFAGDEFDYTTIQLSLYHGNNSGQGQSAPNTCQNLIQTSTGLMIVSLEEGSTYTVVIATQRQYSLYLMSGSDIVEDPLTKATKITMLVIGAVIGLVVFVVAGVLLYYTWWIPNQKQIRYKIDKMFDKQWEPLPNDEEDTTFSVYDPDEEEMDNIYV